MGGESFWNVCHRWVGCNVNLRDHEGQAQELIDAKKEFCLFHHFCLLGPDIFCQCPAGEKSVPDRISDKYLRDQKGCRRDVSTDAARTWLCRGAEPHYRVAFCQRQARSAA